MKVFTSRCLGQTEKIAAELATKIRPGGLIALYGGMGSGKTAFVRGFCSYFGMEDQVSSPTFAIVNEYSAPVSAFSKGDTSAAEKLKDTILADEVPKFAVPVTEESQGNALFSFTPKYNAMTAEEPKCDASISFAPKCADLVAKVPKSATPEAIIHFDMYRVTSQHELESTGFYDYLDSKNILLVEWSENVERWIEPDFRVRLIQMGPEERQISIEELEQRQ